MFENEKKTIAEFLKYLETQVGTKNGIGFSVIEKIEFAADDYFSMKAENKA